MAKKITERRMLRRATPLVLAALSVCPDRCRISRELPIGQSIADMVILRDRPERRWPGAPLTVAESVILSLLRQRGATDINTISRHVFMSAGDVRELLDGRLSEWKLVRSKERGLVEARAAWVRQADLIAVEAKLTRWREALDQAAIYRRYADRAYVLLPEAIAETAAQHREKFRKLGVGLLAYDNQGVTCVIDSKKVNMHNWHREFALSRI